VLPPSVRCKIYWCCADLRKDGKSAVIKHKTIEGFMEAMTMSYPAAETSDLEKVHPGDHITATVYHDPLNNRFWVGNMQVETGTHL